MVTVDALHEDDLPHARRLHNRFTASNVPTETVESWYDEAPELFVAAYDDDELVGYCLGLVQANDRIELRGIGIQPAYRREGIGTTLVQAFEARVAERSVDRISVDSAGGYVDQFYVKNGYAPSSILVQLDPSEVPSDYDRLGFDVVEERHEDGVTRLYVDVEKVDTGVITEVRAAFGDRDAIYIMEKEV